MFQRISSGQTPTFSLRIAGSLLFMVALTLSLASRASASVFSWNPLCGSGWHESCSSGHCFDEDGPTHNFNNWGLESCGDDNPPQSPGAGDHAIIPSSGYAVLSSPASVANLTCDGTLVLRSILTATGALQVNGHLTFDGGGIAGLCDTVIAAGATGETTGSSGSIQNGTFTNYGTFSLNGEMTALVINHGARFYNEGLVEIATISIWGTGLEGYDDDPANAFYNNGTFRKVNDPDGFSISRLPFHNTGVVEVRDGLIEMSGGGSSTGAFDIYPDAMLGLSGAGLTFTLNAGTSFPNTGLLRQANGILAVPGDMAIPNLEISSGDLANEGVLTCSKALTFWGANVTGSGSIVIPSGSDMYINGWSNMHDHTITNHGTLHWSNGGFADGWETGFVLNNTGVCEANGAFAGGPGTIHNSGTMNASNFHLGGSAFENSGLVEVNSGNVGIDNFTQTAGTTRFHPGTFFLGEGGVHIEAGLLEGSTNIFYSSLTNTGGVVAPGLPLGTLTVGLGYTQGADGTLQIELGGTDAGQYDYLETSFSTPVSLDGTLEIAITNGYVPQAGDSFVILTHGPRTGEFANVVAPTGACPEHPLFEVVYNPNDVTVVVTTAATCAVIGDLNGSGACDIDDIEPFAALMVSNDIAFNSCADTNSDCSNDGRDIQSFIQILLNP